MKHLCWSLFFKKLQIFRHANVIKKRPQHSCFLVNIADFLILAISKNICKRLFFNFFNGSLLHGPKVLRSRLYDGVRLQGPSHRSRSLVLKQVPTCIQDTKTNTFDKSNTFDGFRSF